MRRRTAAGLVTGLLSPLLLAWTAPPAQAGPIAHETLIAAPAQAPSGAVARTGAEKDPGPGDTGSGRSGRGDRPGKEDRGGGKVNPYTPTAFDRAALPAPRAERNVALPRTTRLDRPPADFPGPWPPKSAPEPATTAPQSAVPPVNTVSGHFDSITFEPGKIRLKGWALNLGAPDVPVQVVARKETGETSWSTANTYRPDVGHGDHHGFDFTFPLPPAKGAHGVCMQVYVNRAYTNLGCIDYDTRPFGAYTEHFENVVVPTGRYSVFRGWLIDPYTAGAAQLDVVRDGTKVLTVPAADPHPALAQTHPTFGIGHGFEVWMKHELADGTHTICMYGAPAVSRTLLGCKEHTEDHVMRGALDQVDWKGENVLVKGWAIDPDTTGAVSVEIKAGGKLVKTVPANLSRPDVAALHPQYGALHGFETTIPAALNEQEVTVVAKNANAGGADGEWRKGYDGSSGPCRCVRENFEAGSLEKSLYFRAQGGLTSDPARRVSGTYASYGEAPASRPWSEFLWSDPAKLRLAPLTAYTVTFKYRLLAADGTAMHPYVLARTPSGGVAKDAGFTMWDEVSDGDVKSRSVTFTTNEFGDYYLIWGLHDGGAMAVDDVVLSGPLG